MSYTDIMLDLKRAFDVNSAQPEYQPQEQLYNPDATVVDETTLGGQNFTPPQPAYAPSVLTQRPGPLQPPQPQRNLNFAGGAKPQTEQTLLTWSAASRPFKRRNKQFYTTIGIIVFLVSIILFFAGQFLPIAVVISVAFLAYVLSSVPPHEATYRITTFGVRIEDQLYYWEELGRFWFDERYQQKMVHIEVARFPGRLTLMLGQLTETDVEELLKEVLIKQKPADTFFDTSAKWLQEKIPLDNE